MRKGDGGARDEIGGRYNEGTPRDERRSTSGRVDRVQFYAPRVSAGLADGEERRRARVFGHAAVTPRSNGCRRTNCDPRLSQAPTFIRTIKRAAEELFDSS